MVCTNQGDIIQNVLNCVCEASKVHTPDTVVHSAVGTFPIIYRISNCTKHITLAWFYYHTVQGVQSFVQQRKTDNISCGRYLLSTNCEVLARHSGVECATNKEYNITSCILLSTAWCTASRPAFIHLHIQYITLSRFYYTCACSTNSKHYPKWSHQKC